MDELELQDTIEAALSESELMQDMGVSNIRSFDAAGVLTMNKGIVLRVGNAEFQLTIVRSR